LAVMAPGTADVKYPLAIFVDCAGLVTTRGAFYEQKWGMYVVKTCDGGLEPRAEVEQYVGLLLRQQARGLPLWLEVGSARLAARAERSKDESSVLIGQADASDIASHRKIPLPVRSVLGATRAGELWNDARLRSNFAQQAWLYTRQLAANGMLEKCLQWPAETTTPEVELRRCLGMDIDVFHTVVLERWAEGFKTIRLSGGYALGPTTETRLGDRDFKAVAVDMLLGANATVAAQKYAREWAIHDSGIGAEAIAARVLLLSGDTAGAERAFKTALEATYDNVVAYHFAAALLQPIFRKDSIDAISTQGAATAEGLLIRVIDEYPLADAMALLGVARLKAGDSGGAVQSLSDAVAAWPRHEYVLWLARALAASGRFAAARRTAGPLQEIGDTRALRKQARDFIVQLPDQEGELGPLPILPVLRAGERRMRGRLMGVECTSEWTSLRIQQASGTVAKLATAKLSLTKLTFFGLAPAPLRCGPRENPESIVAVWKWDERTPGGSEGIVLSVAFMPEQSGKF